MSPPRSSTWSFATALPSCVLWVTLKHGAPNALKVQEDLGVEVPLASDLKAAITRANLAKVPIGAKAALTQ
jgi:hypothetical protein